MRKLSQVELLNEGFLDAVRAAVPRPTPAETATSGEYKKAAKDIGAATPGLIRKLGRGIANTAAYANRLDKEGFNVLKDPLKKFINNDAVFFLKENLKKNTGIELIKVVNSTTQQANPTKSFYNRIFGPKTVTIITFTGTTYRKNAERQYKTYGEANELMAPGSGSQLANRNNNQLAARSQQLGPRRINNQMRNASGRVIDTAPQGLPAPNDSTTIPEKEIVPNQIVMAAEVFRTADGFQLGDIYNPKTGEIVFTSPKPTTKKVSKTSQKNTLQQLNNLRK